MRQFVPAWSGVPISADGHETSPAGAGVAEPGSRGFLREAWRLISEWASPTSPRAACSGICTRMIRDPKRAVLMEHAGLIASLAKHLLQLENPKDLCRRPEYQKQPDQPWVSGGLAELRSLQQLVCAHPSAVERDLLDDLERPFSLVARTNEAWLREQLHRELAALVRYYGSTGWADAIREDLSGETWYVLNVRDQIEAILKAPELLAVEVRFPIDLRNRIEHADALLQTVEEVQVEYADTDLEDRKKKHSPQDWWWWMDKRAAW